MDPLILVYKVLPALLLVYGLGIVVAGRRLAASTVALIGLVLGAALVFVCASWINSLLPPMGRDWARFVKADLLFFGVPGVTITVAGLALRRLPSPLWAKASTIVVLFLIAFVAGTVLSARVVDFANASG
jgi:ABC-type lipoprotein release transport system permease subunit